MSYSLSESLTTERPCGVLATSQPPPARPVLPYQTTAQSRGHDGLCADVTPTGTHNGNVTDSKSKHMSRGVFPRGLKSYSKRAYRASRYIRRRRIYPRFSKLGQIVGVFAPIYLIKRTEINGKAKALHEFHFTIHRRK